MPSRAKHASLLISSNYTMLVVIVFSKLYNDCANDQRARVSAGVAFSLCTHQNFSQFSEPKNSELV